MRPHPAMRKRINIGQAYNLPPGLRKGREGLTLPSMIFRDRKEAKNPVPMPPWLKIGLVAFVLYGVYAVAQNPHWLSGSEWNVPPAEAYRHVLTPDAAEGEEQENPSPKAPPVAGSGQ